MLHLYLTTAERDACVKAFDMVTRWTCGDTSVFVDMVLDGRLVKKGGVHPLDLSSWSNVYEPLLSEYARLSVGSTPGMVLDVHDPATHPFAALALLWKKQFQSTPSGVKHTSFAAWPADMAVHKKADNVFDIYTISGNHATLNAEHTDAVAILKKCIVPANMHKVAIAVDTVNALIKMLDIYTRVMMHQWEYLQELTEDRWMQNDDVTYDDLRNIVNLFKPKWTGYDVNASSGIWNPSLAIDACIVFSIKNTVRHWDAVHRMGYTKRGVATDGPLHFEKWPLVDGPCVGLDAIPIGGGIVKEGSDFLMRNSFFPLDSKERALAKSYSLVSLLDAFDYSNTHAAESNNLF